MGEMMRTGGQSAAQSIEQVLVGGDLSRLSAEQRVAYVNRLCESLGLNPLTRPFEYIPLNGKLVCYATRACSEQLRKINSVSIVSLERRHISELGLFEVVARGRDKTGREDESSAVLSIGGLKGEPLANALMKCETKAKRRLTLSICGLGFLDETEVETIPGVGRPLPADPVPAKPQGGLAALKGAVKSATIEQPSTPSARDGTEEQSPGRGGSAANAGAPALAEGDGEGDEFFMCTIDGVERAVAKNKAGSEFLRVATSEGQFNCWDENLFEVIESSVGQSLMILIQQAPPNVKGAKAKIVEVRKPKAAPQGPHKEVDDDNIPF